jgi:hypothetical protein
VIRSPFFEMQCIGLWAYVSRRKPPHHALAVPFEPRFGRGVQDSDVNSRMQGRALSQTLDHTESAAGLLDIALIPCEGSSQKRETFVACHEFFQVVLLEFFKVPWF